VRLAVAKQERLKATPVHGMIRKEEPFEVEAIEKRQDDVSAV